MCVSKTRLAIGTSLMALTFGMLGGGTAYAFQEHMFNGRNDLQQAVNGTQPGRTRQRWTPRKRRRVGATSDQPGQSRHCGWWGHALAAEVTAAVRRGAHSSPAQLLRLLDIEPDFDDNSVPHPRQARGQTPWHPNRQRSRGGRRRGRVAPTPQWFLPLRRTDTRRLPGVLDQTFVHNHLPLTGCISPVQV
jgi:hypothetical protein